MIIRELQARNNMVNYSNINLMSIIHFASDALCMEIKFRHAVNNLSKGLSVIRGYIARIFWYILHQNWGDGHLLSTRFNSKSCSRGSNWYFLIVRCVIYVLIRRSYSTNLFSDPMQNDGRNWYSKTIDSWLPNKT